MSNRKGPGRTGRHYARRRNLPGSKIIKRHLRGIWDITHGKARLGAYVSTPRKGEEIRSDDGRLIRAAS